MLKPINPIKPLLFGFTSVNLIVVGAGGTGGYLLQSLARLLVHLGKPESVMVTVLDGDSVEEKNVGRQLFSYAEIGRNKAETLVRRFNIAFGLTMMAIPRMATHDLLHSLCYSTKRDNHANIVIGCVDSTAARRVIHMVVGSPQSYKTYWLDCGNSDQSGQVLFGNARTMQLQGSLSNDLCLALPLPSVLYPELIETNDVPVVPVAPAANCAADLAQNRQGLNVNQQIATIAAQYIHNLLINRRLERYQTTVDLASMDMQSLTITPMNVARSLDVEPEFLTTTKGQ